MIMEELHSLYQKSKSVIEVLSTIAEKKVKLLLELTPKLKIL
jgi:hypothetical protein